MDKLMPCPFCGGEPIINVTSIDYFGKDVRYYHVACLDCMIEQPHYRYEWKNEAIEAWNKRKGDAKDGNM